MELYANFRKETQKYNYNCPEFYSSLSQMRQDSTEINPTSSYTEMIKHGTCIHLVDGRWI